MAYIIVGSHTSYTHRSEADAGKIDEIIERELDRLDVRFVHEYGMVWENPYKVLDLDDPHDIPDLQCTYKGHEIGLYPYMRLANDAEWWASALRREDDPHKEKITYKDRFDKKYSKSEEQT